MSTISEYIVLALMVLIVLFTILLLGVVVVMIVELGKSTGDSLKRLMELIPQIMELPPRRKFFLMLYLLFVAMILLSEFWLVHKWMYEHHLLPF